MHGTDCFVVPPGGSPLPAPTPGSKQEIWRKHADIYRHIFQSGHLPKALGNQLVRGLAHADLLSSEGVNRVAQLHAEVKRKVEQCRESATASTHEARVYDDLGTVADLLLELQKHCKEYQQRAV